MTWEGYGLAGGATVPEPEATACQHNGRARIPKTIPPPESHQSHRGRRT